jgi:Xaa-Pro aminopeptidase
MFIAFGGVEPVRHWPPFYQIPAFRYLTGFLQSNAALVLVREDGQTTSTLFVTRPDARRALYDGERLTLEGVSEELGLEARYIESMQEYVDASVERGLPVYSVADFQANEFSQRDSLTVGRTFTRKLMSRHPGLEVVEVNGWVDQLRAKKSDAEVAIPRSRP